MAVVRLTKEMRRSIVQRAIMDAFDARQEAMDRAENDLAFRCREHVHGKDVIEKIEAIAKQWFNMNSYMEFNCNGPSIRLQFGCVVRLTDSERYNSFKHLIKDQALRMEVLTHADNRSTLKKERSTAENALENLILRCSTLKILSEQWPEGHAYYKHLEGTVKQLPAVKTDEVNKLLGLPK